MSESVNTFCSYRQDYVLEAQSLYPDDYLKAKGGPSWTQPDLAHKFGGGHPYWGREYNEAWKGVYEPFP